MSSSDDSIFEEAVVQPNLLDFSRMTFKKESELQSALKQVPDQRQRQEKVRDFEVLCESKGEGYPFGNPVPVTLREIRIRDLSRVPIDWRMMTLVRPPTKQEEDIFTKLVNMDRQKMTSCMDEKCGDLVSRRPPLYGPGPSKTRWAPEAFCYGFYARDKEELKPLEDCTDYVQQVTEFLSTSKLEGDFTKRILQSKKMKSKKNASKPSRSHSDHKEKHRRRKKKAAGTSEASGEREQKSHENEPSTSTATDEVNTTNYTEVATGNKETKSRKRTKEGSKRRIPKQNSVDVNSTPPVA